jgi:phytanoyl-CoA hydroxylase
MLSSVQVESFRDTGYLLLPSGFDRGTMDRIAADILAQLEEVERRRAADTSRPDPARFRRWVLGLHRHSPRIRDFVLSDAFKAIGSSLIGNEVDMYFTSTITKSPGRNHSVDWHQDVVYEQDGHSPRLLCWTSVTASNRENGGLSVIPGSHRAGLLPHEPSALYPRDQQTVGVDPSKALPMDLNPGDILVLHPHLVHGSPESSSSGHRIALMSGYQRPKPDYTEREEALRIPLLRNGSVIGI